MFKVGDRVKMISSYSGVSSGELGEIQRISGTGLGLCDLYVRWDSHNGIRHDNDGLCEKGHGWMVSYEDVELIETPEDLGEILIPEIDIISLFA